MPSESLFDLTANSDAALNEVIATLRRADPLGERAARVLRETYDQLYDGQRSGRYAWSQLFKTEKTHFGTLIEINLRREFNDVISDGKLLDFNISGHEIDCKYTQRDGGWMLPPECFEQLLLVCTADDQAATWSLGVVRATELHRNKGANRDAKATLNVSGRTAVQWLQRDADLPPNVLLALDPKLVSEIFGFKSGQRRVNELFRSVQNVRIGRNAVATVAQQVDYMKRVRYDGGARSSLAWEGIMIPGGDYKVHRNLADAIGATVPQPGEFVSFTVMLAKPGDSRVVELEGTKWRLALPGETATEFAPKLPGTRTSKG